MDYISEIPDADGGRYNAVYARRRAADPVTAGPFLPLRFFRSVCTRGCNKAFTLGPLGYNSMRVCLDAVNCRLPEYLRLDHATGHSGRKSLVTIACNSNVSAEVVAIASHHKDPKTLMGYIAPSTLTMMTAGLAVGSAAAESRRRSRHVAGIDLQENVTDVNVGKLAACSISDEVPTVSSESVSNSFTAPSGCVYHFHFAK